jgi:hypothetical protein
MTVGSAKLYVFDKHMICSGGGHYSASRKVAGSSPDEVDLLFLPNPSGRTGPGVDSASKRNEYQECLKIKKPGGSADNLAAI